ncbi:hypothetical protein ABBQ32_000969 [Trebouxia sp. C0010 RCD-2024]
MVNLLGSELEDALLKHELAINHARRRGTAAWSPSYIRVPTGHLFGCIAHSIQGRRFTTVNEQTFKHDLERAAAYSAGSQDEGHLPQAEGLQQALTPSPPQGRDDHAKEDSILQEAIPQVIRHVDYDISYNYVSHRYKAKVYLNGQRVQEMFDFDLQELKLRLGIRIKQLDATSSVPLTKAVLWTSQPGPWDPKVKAV